MGVVHELINHKNKTLFNLGKGPFFNLNDHQNLEILCDNDLRYDLLYSFYNKEEKPDKEWEDYIKWFSDRIGEFIGDATVNDISWHCDNIYDEEYINCKYEQGYLNAGSRFAADYENGKFIGNNAHLFIYKNNLKKQKLKDMGYVNDTKQCLIKENGQVKILTVYKTYDLDENGEVKEKISETITDYYLPVRSYRNMNGVYLIKK